MLPCFCCCLFFKLFIYLGWGEDVHYIFCPTEWRMYQWLARRKKPHSPTMCGGGVGVGGAGVQLTSSTLWRPDIHMNSTLLVSICTVYWSRSCIYIYQGPPLLSIALFPYNHLVARSVCDMHFDCFLEWINHIHACSMELMMQSDSEKDTLPSCMQQQACFSGGLYLCTYKHIWTHI